MKIKMMAAILMSVFLTGCEKTQTVREITEAASAKGTSEAYVLKEPPPTWQEHWFEHIQLLNRVYLDNNLALYYDNETDTSILWPRKFLAQVWDYTKATYGSFGDSPQLYAIFHTGKYSGGHPGNYLEQAHDNRNVIDCGTTNGTWASGTGNDLDLPVHEVGHIVEGASKGVHNSPAFNIWHDSKWMEIYIYDVYLGLGRTEDAQRWYNLVTPNTEDYPRAGTHWFKNWWLPIYNNYGGKVALNNYFTLLAQHFPKHTVSNGSTMITEYTRDLNYGEFIHFWSGAAGADLEILALNAFGNKDENGNDWTVQLAKARADFAAVKYDRNDITPLATLSVNQENEAGASAPEGSLKLIDGDTRTKLFIRGYSNTFAATLSFPTGQVVRNYSVSSGNDLPDRDPKNWILFGTDNGQDRTVLDSRMNEIFEDRMMTKNFTISNTKPYKSYILEVTGNNGSRDFQFSEWRLFR